MLSLSRIRRLSCKQGLATLGLTSRSLDYAYGRRCRLPVASYSTRSGASTSNSNDRAQTKSSGQKIDSVKTLVYIGPFSKTIRSYKITSSLLGLCGVTVASALLLAGQAPVMFAVLVGASAAAPCVLFHYTMGSYVVDLCVHEHPNSIHRKRSPSGFTVPSSDDLMLLFQTYNLVGRLQETRLPLGALRDAALRRTRFMTWEVAPDKVKEVPKGGRRNFFVEKVVFEQDLYLKGIMQRIAGHSGSVKDKIVQSPAVPQDVKMKKGPAKKNRG